MTLPMLVCPTCRRTFPANARFCPEDGTPLVVAPPPGAPPAGYPAPTLPAPPVEPRRSRTVLVTAIVLGLVLAAGAAAAYVLHGPSGLEKQALAAIARGDLVTPTRVSAYDFAQRLQADYPNSSATERVGQAAFAPLIVAMDEFYARFQTTSDATPAEWDRLSRLAAWATEIAPTDPQVHARKAYADAHAAAERDDAAAARAGYEDATAAWPAWALPPNSLGRVLLAAGDERGAEAQYREATRRNPDWPFPLSNLGALYLRTNRSAEAVDVLARAVQLDPNRPFTHALYARALAAQGRYGEAADEAETALRLDPTGGTNFNARTLGRDAGQWRLLSQGVVDWDGDGVVEPDPVYYDDYGE